MQSERTRPSAMRQVRVRGIARLYSLSGVLVYIPDDLWAVWSVGLRYWRRSMERKKSMVFARPSRRGIWGSHLSILRAREMSGRRWVGSSLGRGRWTILDLEPVSS